MNRTIYRITLFFFAATLLESGAGTAVAQLKDFVKRHGDKLELRGKPFRGAGVNIYWLGLDENVNGVGYPTHFRVVDALDTAKWMGANIVRAHTLGVSTGNALSVEPSLGHFNEDAFQAIDFAIAEASKRGIRLVIPLTDNYAYYHGGRHNFADWRSVPVDQFYTNVDVIHDFEGYIEHLLNHRSSITGIAMKDDPAILAWETGNEIRPPTAWTETISKYIKQQDGHHLVLDGHYGVDVGALQLESVDLVGAHFNGTAYKMLSNAVVAQTALAEGKRPYFIGEFDWNNHHSTGKLDEFLAAVEQSQAVAGVTLWSLMSHRDDSGFVKHNDGFSLHYPGDDEAMQAKVKSLEDFFHRFARIPVKEEGLGTPLITSVANGKIRWRGVAGASSYQVEGSSVGPNGPWSVLVSNTPEGESALPDSYGQQRAWYRVRAVSASSKSGPFSAVYEGRGSASQ